MIYSFIQFIEHIVIPLGALGVFFAEVIEEIVVPIPSALILFTSGFVLLKGETSLELLRNLFFIITLPGALGLTLGSTVIYCLGFYGGKPFIEKYGSYLGISWSEVLDFDDKMNKSKYDEYLFVFARILPIVPSSLIAVFSGVTRMPIKKYILLTFVASIVKASIYAYIGYKVGEVYYIYAKQISNMENTGFVVAILLIVAFIVYRIYRKYYK
ncbi:MAG: hypothetical protein CEO12_242 [Parcubacteria group bacterium Gr01-1014_46]|nr:MAG: hypothetical protein CEO12_242 [Parcubacteria group bacterium Gr01-1014_46]